MMNTMKLTAAALLLVVKGCNGFGTGPTVPPSGKATARPTFPKASTLPPTGNKIKTMSNKCRKHDFKFNSCTTCDCAGRVLEYGNLFHYGTVLTGTNKNCIYYGEHSLSQINGFAEQQCNKDCDCGGFYDVTDTEGGAICFKGTCECGTHPGIHCHTKIKPTNAPTRHPTRHPTKHPTTKQPTKHPTKLPTKHPTKHPTPGPTTKQPTKQPTSSPTMRPTANMCAQYEAATVEFVPERCKCQRQCENPFQVIQTKRNIFVADMSLSMKTQFTDEGGIPTSRMEQMKLSLAYQLTNLTSTQYFLVIKFANDVKTGTWTKATKINVNNYVKTEISAWKASSTPGTSTKAALVSAYAQATLGKNGDYGVYFLSDGAPNPTGVMTQAEMQEEQSTILGMAKQWRKSYKINTVAWVQGCSEYFPEECTAAGTFMKSLGSRTKGRFRAYTTLDTAAAQDARQKIQWGIDTCKRNCDNLFGKITQQKVAFVIDTSSSMQYQDAATGTSRLDAVVKQLGEQLANSTNGVQPGLGPSQSFIFVTYSTGVQTWPQSGLLLATNANKTVAIKEMIGWTPDGETHTETALKAALSMDVDVIYLLSDGVPEVGGSTRPSLRTKIVMGVDPSNSNANTNWNTNSIPINTICFTRGGEGEKDESPTDKKAALTFMMNVAQATTGTCLDCNCEDCVACGDPCQASAPSSH